MNRSLSTLLHSLLLALITIAPLSHAQADEPKQPEATQARFDITYSEIEKYLGDQTPLFKENIRVAAQLWADKLDGNGIIQLHVQIVEGEGGGEARCPAAKFVKKIGDNELYEMSACTKIRNGITTKSKVPDIEYTIYSSYLKELFIDPEPAKRTAKIPLNQFDLVSLTLHEICHGLGFNGWLNEDTGQLDGNVLSTYDQYVIHQDGEFWFVGLEALKVNGAAVPLSHRNNNYHHIGRKGIHEKGRLGHTLMNGVYFWREHRYHIDDLTLAILQDTGLPVKRTPE